MPPRKTKKEENSEDGFVRRSTRQHKPVKALSFESNTKSKKSAR
jgi:hypothetical protein